MKLRHQSRSTAFAFTLIELLVVIAIIAILAAILFPVFAKAREKARQTACLSNCKQLGLGFIQYTTDYDEQFPNGNYKYGPISGWGYEIYTYVKSTSVFRCPDDANAYKPTSGTIVNPSNYAMNENFGRQGNLNGSPPVPNIAWGQADLNAVAKTVLLFEVQGNGGVMDITQFSEANFGGSVNYGGSPEGNGALRFNEPNGSGTHNNCTAGTLVFATGYLSGRNPTAAPAGDISCQYTGPLGIHSDGSNYVLADGHAKWMMGAAVSSGPNPINNNPAATQIDTGTGRAAGTAGTFVGGGQPAATFSIF